MSQTKSPNQQPDDEVLEELLEISDDLKIIAESDAEYAKYAKTGLRKLREAGYDV